MIALAQPAADLRALLAEYRREGEDFADVWSACVARVVRSCGRSEGKWWQEVWIEQRAAWEDAYHRRGKAALDPALLDDALAGPARTLRSLS